MFGTCTTYNDILMALFIEYKHIHISHNLQFRHCLKLCMAPAQFMTQCMEYIDGLTESQFVRIYCESYFVDMPFKLNAKLYRGWKVYHKPIIINKIYNMQKQMNKYTNIILKNDNKVSVKNNLYSTDPLILIHDGNNRQLLWHRDCADCSSDNSFSLCLHHSVCSSN